MIRRRTTATLLAAGLLWLAGVTIEPADASAQQKQRTKGRFSTSFETGLGERAELTLRTHADGDKLDVRIRSDDAANRVYQVTSLPEWVGDYHYGYRVDARQLDADEAAVVLIAEPGARAAPPPGAVQYHAAWHVRRDGERLEWTPVGTAQSSELDGGEHLEIRKTGPMTAELVRRTGTDTSGLCGVPRDQPVSYERYDASSQTFRPTMDLSPLLVDAPTLTAALPTVPIHPPALQGWYQWFSATSDRRNPDRSTGALVRPLELGDYRPETAWSEGGEGYGRGESASAHIGDVLEVRGFRIFPGVGHERFFDQFARPTRLLFALDDQRRYVVELEAASLAELRESGGLYVGLPEPVKTRCLSVMILDGTGGAKRDPTTAIAEVTPVSTIHGADAAETARLLVARLAGEPDLRKRERLAELARGLGQALTPAVTDALENREGIERRRIVSLLSAIPSDEAVPVLVVFLEELDVGDPSYRAVKRALATHREAAAPSLAKMLRDERGELSHEAHLDLLRLMGRVATHEHLAELIPRLGRGTTQMRNARVRAISAGGAPLVEPLVAFAIATDEPAALYDALKALNLVGRRAYYHERGPMPAGYDYIALLDEVRDRRTLMRGLRAAGYFDIEGFVVAVQERFSDHTDPLVRREAYAALARDPSPEARKTIEDGLFDSSPDVRIEAIKVLNRRDDAAEAVPRVLDYVNQETWRPGLQTGYDLLARSESQSSMAAFRQVLKNRPKSEAARLAATALDRAGRHIDAELAIGIISDPAVDLRTRIELVDVLGNGRSERGEAFLLSLLEPSARQPLVDGERADERLLEHVILALGRRRSDTGKIRLFQIARHAEVESHRKFAIRSLGFYADPDLASALSAWRSEAPPSLRSLIDQTQSMIKSRITIGDITEDIDGVLEDGAD